MLIWPLPLPKVRLWAAFEPTATVIVPLSPFSVELKLLVTAEAPKPSAVPIAPPTVMPTSWTAVRSIPVPLAAPVMLVWMLLLASLIVLASVEASE